MTEGSQIREPPGARSADPLRKGGQKLQRVPTNRIDMNYKKPIPKSIKSRNLSRVLRNNATREENHLWYDFLRNYPIRFHRQYVIENYIVDFFCPKAKIIVEIDGSQHYYPENEVYDKRRTEIIERYGFTVIRYTNIDINQRFKAVCDDINNKVTESLHYNPYAKAPFSKGAVTK